MSFELNSLDEVADVVDSLHKTPTYSETGYPMVRGTDVKYGTLDLSSTFKVAETVFLDFSRKYKPSPKDIIITRVGTYGVTSQVKEINFCLGQNTAAIIPSQINADYLFYVLNSPYLKSQIESGVVGSTQKTLSLKVIKSFKIPRFDKSLEAEIASILSALDNRISLLHETNTTLEAIAQTLFKSWFVDFDPVKANVANVGAVLQQPPVHQSYNLPPDIAALFPSEFEESALGLIPKGWRVGTLGNVMKNESSTFNFSGVEKVIFINTGDVSDGQFLHSDFSAVDTLKGQAKKAIRENDVLFSEIRPKNKRFAYVNFDPKNYVVSTKFMVLRSSHGIHPRYIYQVLRQSEIIETFNVIADSRSGTFPQITFDAIKAVKVVIPSNECINRYIDYVSAIFQKVDLNFEQQKELKDIRDTLLPRLISGQLRLNVGAIRESPVQQPPLQNHEIGT